MTTTKWKRTLVHDRRAVDGRRVLAAVGYEEGKSGGESASMGLETG